MSLKIINIKPDTSELYPITNVITQVNSELGFELLSNLKDNDSYGRDNMDIKFPDMSEPVTVNVQTSYSNLKKMCFIDLDNHFFLIYENANESPNHINDSDYHRFFNCIVFETEEGSISSIQAFSSYSESSYAQSTFFNIPSKMGNDPSKNTLRMFLAYYSGTGFIKNMYFNCDRAFETAGLKFVDENNNEFITLGGYLLYYNGKHK